MLTEGSPALVGVIEDDDVSRHALGRLLLAGGFEPALFDSAETFIASPPQRAFFCLIVDVHLTGMSGIDLQDRLRGQGSDVPVIMTTGDRRETIRARAERAGCTAFLWKPFSPDVILDVLEAIVRRPPS